MPGSTLSTKIEISRKLKSNLERYYPWIIAILVAAVNWCFARNYPLLDFTKDLLIATLNLSSITIGFLSTSLSILASIEQTYIVKQLKQAGVYNKLINYFRSAIAWSFVVVILDIFGLTINFKMSEWWKEMFFVFWAFSVALALASTYRILSVFTKLLKSI